LKAKIIILSLLIFFGSNLLYSQIIKDYGVKIGLTSSNIYVRNLKPIVDGNSTYYVNYPSGQLISPTISLWAKLIENKIIDLEIETSYILKGMSEAQTVHMSTNPDGPFIEEKYDFSLTLKYIQINLNSQIKYDVEKIKLYGIVGPAVSYLLVNENFLMDKNKRKKIILGYNLGLGIDFSNLIDKNVFIEIKYNGDFTSFYSENADVWNKVLVFSIGTKF